MAACAAVSCERLRWSDIDLASEPGTIHVRRTWDDIEDEVSAKSEAGFRVVPLAGRLRALVVAHKLRHRTRR